MKKIVPISILFLLIVSCAQKTTPKTVGIQYPSYQPIPAFVLDSKIDESSGLEVYEDFIYTLNDSGGKAVIYKLSLDGKLVEEIPITNASNEDWESLDIDHGMMTIGDFGNNRGSRKDLKVYQVPMSNLNQEPRTTSFSYKSQSIFDYENLTTPYDCEALFYADDSYYIISKNWRDGISSLYKIKENNPEPLNALQLFQFNALVTGADYNSERKILACSAYADFEMYIFLFLDSVKGEYFSKNVLKIHLDGLSDAQVEGISFLDNDHLLITTEETKVFPAQAWTINLADLIPQQ